VLRCGVMKPRRTSSAREPRASCRSSYEGQTAMNARLAWDILRPRRQFHRREWWDRPRLERYQASTRRGLRDFAYRQSPFYQRFHRGAYAAPLEDLPVLTKAMVMDHFDDLVTDRAIHLDAVKAYVAHRRGDERFLDRYWVKSTSGTSGQPGLFLS